MRRTLAPQALMLDQLLMPLAVMAGACGWLLTRTEAPFAAVLVLLALVLAWLAPAWSLVLLALIAPFETFQELPLLGTVHTSELLLLAFLPGWFWNWMARPAWRKPLAPAINWVLPFLAVLLIQALLHPTFITLKANLRWLEFFLVLLAGVHWLRRPRQAWALWWALIAAFSLNGLMGLAQIWQGRAFWSHLLTWHTHFGEVVRASGEYGPNTLAGVIVLVLPLVTAFFLFSQKSVIKKISFLLLVVLLSGLIATFSVIGMASAALSVLFLTLMMMPRPLTTSLYLVGALLLALVLMMGLHGSSGLQTMIKLKAASLSDRLDYMQVAGHLLAAHPWLGIGPGCYKTTALAWRHQDMNIIGLITHPHALWLLILVENGIAGLAAMLWGLGRVAFHIIKKAYTRQDPMLWAACAGLAAVAFLNLGEQGLVHDRGVHVALALAATLVLVTKKNFPKSIESRHCFERQWQQQAQHPGWAREVEERRKDRQVLYAILDQALAGRPAAKVLEIGCGPGLDALILTQHGHLEVHGLDSSPAALQLAREASQALQRPLALHHGDVRCTGLPAQSFDLIFSQGLLEHFEDPGPVWREMDRLLIPGGAVVVDVPQTFNPYTVIKWVHRLKGTWPWGWETQYTVGQLKHAGQSLGWKVTPAKGYGYRRGKWDITYGLKRLAGRCWPEGWARWERTWGAYWMMNVAVLFEKGKAL